MSTLTWLHISDLHLRVSETYDQNVILQTLLHDITGRIEQDELRPDFILVTGDVAFSGQPAEYQQAWRFFRDLLKVTTLDVERLFLVPGNHDVDRSAISGLLARAASALDSSDAVSDLLAGDTERALVFQPMRNYGDFIERHFGSCLRFDDEHYFYVRTLDLAGHRIALLGLNSAWLALSDQDRGNVVLGEQQVSTALEQATDCDLKIALLHHPLDWLRSFDRAVCEPLLTQSCDFVLHSGLHHTGLSFMQRRDVRATMISTGATYVGRQQRNAYNFVRLDFAAGRGRMFLRVYSEQAGGFWTKDTITHRNAPDGVYAFSLRLGWSPPKKKLPTSVSTPAKVFLEELDLTNFRCFKREVFPLSEEFTVLVGDNGSGKTAILEALAIGVGAFFLGIDGLDAPSIEPDQARLVRYEHGETSTCEPQYPVQVTCKWTWGRRRIEATRTCKGEGESVTEEGAEKIQDLARHLQSQVRQGADVVLPVIANYGTGRLWRAPQEPIMHLGEPQARFTSDLDRPGSRYRGYENCLDPSSHVGELRRWMRTQELIALQKRPGKVLKAVKDAITNCVENLESVSYNVSEGDIYVYFCDGRALPFRMLSEGVRNVLAMVADIAHRATILNPDLERPAEQTPGVVLIDEIDLHLHPEWQRHVVEDLRRTFPRMQFIATTHSPFIIQSLRPGELVDLNERKRPVEKYAEESIEDIVERVMGVNVPQRSWRYQRMYEAAKEYYQVLQEAQGADPKKKKELKRRLDDLVAPFSDNVAYHAFLEMERKAAGVGEDDDEAR